MLSLYRNVLSVLLMTYLCLCRCGAMLSLYRNVLSELLMTCLCVGVERCYHYNYRNVSSVLLMTYLCVGVERCGGAGVLLAVAVLGRTHHSGQLQQVPQQLFEVSATATAHWLSVCSPYRMTSLGQAISRSSQCSTTGVTKDVVCAILSVG